MFRQCFDQSMELNHLRRSKAKLGTPSPILTIMTYVETIYFYNTCTQTMVISMMLSMSFYRV